MTPLDTLRDAGMDVEVTHKRFITDGRFCSMHQYQKEKKKHIEKGSTYPGIDPRGGETTVSVAVDGRKYSHTAACSRKDNFNKKIGVSIAAGRVLKHLRMNGILDFATKAKQKPAHRRMSREEFVGKTDWLFGSAQQAEAVYDVLVGGEKGLVSIKDSDFVTEVLRRLGFEAEVASMTWA